MSDASNNNGGEPVAPASGADPAAGPPHFRLVSQYAKDLSFESPRPPMQLPHTIGVPEINISVNVNARSLDAASTRFEIELSLEARARKDDSVVFIAEIVYAGVVELTNVADEIKPLLTMVEVPRLLFPFARRILSDLVRDGGFPPLMVEPIDFLALYRRHVAQAGAAAQASG